MNTLGNLLGKEEESKDGPLKVTPGKRCVAVANKIGSRINRIREGQLAFKVDDASKIASSDFEGLVCSENF